MPDETVASETVQQERDAWIKAIDKLCSEWKRKSKMFTEQKSFRHVSIPEDTEDNDTDLESSGEFGAGITYPPADNKNADPPLSDGDNLSAQQTHPPADHTKPIPKPRRMNSPQIIPPQVSSPPSPSRIAPTSLTSPPPSPRALPPPPTVQSPALEGGSLIMKGPPPPAPPPLPLNQNSKKVCTKAFHWDLIGPDKVKLSPFITSH